MDLEELSVAADLLRKNAKDCTNNTQRLNVYADSELLGIKIDKLKAKYKDDALLIRLKEEVSQISLSVPLIYVNRASVSPAMKVLNKIDDIGRLIAVWLTLMLSSVFFAIPCILLTPVDYILVRCGIIDVYTQFAVVCKLVLSRTILRMSGIHVVTEGVKQDSFGKECVIACFSHSSSMDAFLMASAVPVTALTVCKKELFLIPFFSCATAFGGVPINRENREQAVQAMEAAASAAKLGECIAVSPEGTRSTTGQLLEFKKGPFYLWEQLKTPIVPIVTMGAFELFPPGSQMSLPGKVYMRFLEPIMPHEASNKDEMCLLVRTRMLEALKKAPEDVACELTWRQRIVCWANLAFLYYFTYHLYLYVSHYDVLSKLQMTHAQLWSLVVSVSVLITGVFYVYAVYCAPFIRACISKKLPTIARRVASIV